MTYSAPAEARHSYPDSNGKVPVHYKCEPNASWLGMTTGRVYNNGRVERHIQVNRCLLERLGGGDQDLRHILSHEHAHARGWRHYEGTPESNPAYYPSYSLCRC